MGSLRDQYVQNAASSGTEYILNDKQLADLQRILLEMLLDILSVCKKYNIEVALCGGSALGAVRHHGFIPWDDDLDILMPRSDYKRFHDAFESEMSDKYYIAAPNQNGPHKQRFPKIFKRNTVYRSMSDVNSSLPSGIYIDVFLVENVPANAVIRTIKGLWCNILMFCGTRVYLFEQNNDIYRSYLCSTPEGKKNYEKVMLLGRMLSCIPSKKWFDIIDKSIQYPKRTGLCSIPTGRKHYFGEIIREEYLFPTNTEWFEGHEVPIPANCDKYLSNMYGNYMQIPPEEKREKHFVVEFDAGE